ncbi:hypothetical protein C8J56DRAFT_892403 [Mycena floridula]|nr:hypothetical protein C8J56DRAFT_892403 [Mycena floridula]
MTRWKPSENYTKRGGAEIPKGQDTTTPRTTYEKEGNTKRDTIKATRSPIFKGKETMPPNGESDKKQMTRVNRTRIISSNIGDETLPKTEKKKLQVRFNLQRKANSEPIPKPNRSRQPTIHRVRSQQSDEVQAIQAALNQDEQESTTRTKQNTCAKRNTQDMTTSRIKGKGGSTNRHIGTHEREHGERQRETQRITHSKRRTNEPGRHREGPRQPQSITFTFTQNLSANPKPSPKTKTKTKRE